MALVDPITGRKIVEIPQSYDIATHATETEMSRALEVNEPIIEIKQSETTQREELIETITTKIVDENEVGEKWINIQIDSTMLSVFMGCPQKFDYVFNRHLVPIEGLSKSIIRGTIVHDALLDYWKSRIVSDDYQAAVRAAIKKAKDEIEKDVKFGMDEKQSILQNLLEFLQFIQASSWIPIAAEKYFRVKVFEDPLLKLRIFLVGRIDLILRTPQIPILPIDNKTESERWFYSQMSNQFKIYCIACEVNMLGVQRVGFQETVKTAEKFKIEMLPFDQDILDEFKTITLPYWVKQLMLANEEKYYPMNTHNCVKGHFACQFSDKYNGGICNVSRAVREQKLGRYFVVGEVWDPSL